VAPSKPKSGKKTTPATKATSAKAEGFNCDEVGGVLGFLEAPDGWVDKIPFAHPVR